VGVEQAVQAVVLLGLLWAVTRPAVRAHLAEPVTEPKAGGRFDG
jgi:hypothetical protein